MLVEEASRAEFIHSLVHYQCSKNSLHIPKISREFFETLACKFTDEVCSCIQLLVVHEHKYYYKFF